MPTPSGAKDPEAYSELSNLLYQNAARKLPFVVRLYLSRSLTITRVCWALIRQCSLKSISGQYRAELRKILILLGEALSAASHLYIPISSFNAPKNGSGVQRAGLAFGAVFSSLSKFIATLPAQTMQSISELRDFRVRMQADQTEDETKGYTVFSESARFTEKLVEARRSRFHQRYNESWSSM